jgi:hypothetical protein
VKTRKMISFREEIDLTARVGGERLTSTVDLGREGEAWGGEEKEGKKERGSEGDETSFVRLSLFFCTGRGSGFGAGSRDSAR